MDVMDKDLKVPKLRFKDEDGREFPSWEERSFRDITYVPNSKSVDGKVYPVYSISNVDGFVSREVQFSEGVLEYADKSKCKVVLPGTFAYNPARINVGSIGYQNLAFPVMVSPLYVIFNVIHEVNDKFMWYLLHSDLLPKQIYKFAEGSVRVCFSYDKLCKVALFLPTLPEQKKIADFLTVYDELIDTQSKRVEALKLRKKGLLQKIFSQEIRFKDDEGREFPRWEERKLGEVADRISRKNSDLFTTRPLTISSEYGLIDQEEFFSKKVASENLSSYYLLNKGEFAYNRSSSNGYPYGSVKKLERYDCGAVSTLYICFAAKSSVNSSYLQYFFETSGWHREAYKICCEGARNHGLLNVFVGDFFMIRIPLPTLPEQRKIADFLSVADHQITLEEKRLDIMRLIKKALLQQLFV